jgi:iron complex transport system ATP-binding protein
MADLSFRKVSLAIGGKTVLNDISFTVQQGECIALVGPNGAGKTSLLRAALGLRLAAYGGLKVTGEIRLKGDDPARLSVTERAKRLAYLPQARPLAWPLRVADVVALGRFAWGTGPGRLGPIDQIAVDDALKACDLISFADRRTDQLSGGELARVHVARLLAARAPLLLADEPVAALDPRQALQVMQMLTDHVRSGAAALISLHDLSLAARFADRVLVIAQGRLIADGPPALALAPAILAEAFGVRTRYHQAQSGDPIGVQVLDRL